MILRLRLDEEEEDGDRWALRSADAPASCLDTLKVVGAWDEMRSRTGLAGP